MGNTYALAVRNLLKLLGSQTKRFLKRKKEIEEMTGSNLCYFLGQLIVILSCQLLGMFIMFIVVKRKRPNAASHVNVGPTATPTTMFSTFTFSTSPLTSCVLKRMKMICVWCWTGNFSVFQQHHNPLLQFLVGKNSGLLWLVGKLRLKNLDQFGSVIKKFFLWDLSVLCCGLEKLKPGKGSDFQWYSDYGCFYH